MTGIHIALSAEKVFSLFGVPVTNSLLTTWIAMATVITFSYLATRRLGLVPGNSQLVAEIVVGGLHNLFESVVHERIKTYFPLLATLFLFIISLNWVGLLPGVGSVGFYKLEEGQKIFTPLFRSGTADLNTTLALALLAVMAIQYVGFASFGLTYLKKFFNFTSPINFYVGILELVSEFSRIISFAFRLFGNIFAGEVLLTVIAFLIPLFAPIPFLGLEIFVGFIQALVFSILTAAFLSLAVGHAEH